MDMKNIAISMADDLYSQARVMAAEHSASSFALFKNFLIRLTVSKSAAPEFLRLAREERALFAGLDAKCPALNS